MYVEVEMLDHWGCFSSALLDTVKTPKGFVPQAVDDMFCFSTSPLTHLVFSDLKNKLTSILIIL